MAKSAWSGGGRFCPLGFPNIKPPPASEEEEEEDEIADLVHNFGARKRRRGASFKRATDATLIRLCQVGVRNQQNL